MRLFSTPESVARSEPSWMAILETLWAVLLCWGMVWQGGSLWPVLLPVWLTPWLLLRSPQSTEQGARWFAAYLAAKGRLTPLATPLRFWGVMVPLIVGVTSHCTTLMADHFLPGHADWSLFVRATMVGVVAMWLAMAMAVAGGMAGSVVVALTVLFSLAMGAAQSGVAEVAFSWALAVTLVGMVAATIALMWMGAVAGEGVLAIAIVLAGIPWIVGVWVRSLGVRLLATLLHLWQGVLAMPDNWRRMAWILDSNHPPELVPGLSLWTRALSLAEIQAVLRARGLLRRLFGLSAFLCFFLPAIVYRWSLKSTAWLYWPLLYVERVPGSGDPGAAEAGWASPWGGHWERVRSGLAVVGLLLLFGVFQMPLAGQMLSLLPESVLPWCFAWLGGVGVIGLLTLLIHAASGAATPGVWMCGLIRARTFFSLVVLATALGGTVFVQMRLVR
ncbi:MAG: hypothetical protein H7837_07385 [Magnetococcus sp. MYC-9]